MKKKEIVIGRFQNTYDNPYAELVNAACAYQSEIHLDYEAKHINAKSIMGILAFDVASGAKVTISAEGKDEEEAVLGMEEFLAK